MTVACPVRHVIFDLDGVLLDTEGAYTTVTNEVVAPYGRVFDWSIKRHMVGRPAQDSARYLVNALALPISADEYLALRSQRLESLLRSCKPIAGAERFTRSLAARGLPLAIATSTSSEMFAIKSEKHQAWWSIFSAIVCGDDARVARGKPAPDIFLAAAEKLGAAPNACLVFEDSPFGVEAARSAGMRVVAMPDPHMDRGLYRDAQWIVSGFHECQLAEFGL